MNTHEIKKLIFKKNGIIYDDKDASWEEFLKTGGIKTNKDCFLDWIRSETENPYQIGLTLMPKKLFHKTISVRTSSKPNAVCISKDLYKHLTKNQLLQRANRYMDILNRLTYKNAYKNHDKKLKTLMFLEGEKSQKDLHLHFAFAMPTNGILIKDFIGRIHRAIVMSDDFMIDKLNAHDEDDLDPLEPIPLEKRFHFKTDIVDDGWLTYCTKELDKKDLKNLYLP